MKKITSAIAIACLGISSLTAQTQRTILYEEFTGENCSPCAQTNPGLTTLIHSPGNYPNKICLVRYQCNIPSAPGAGSLYQDNPTEVGTRMTYYSVPFAPYARFDGIELPDPSGSNNGHAALLTQTYINDSSTNNAPFALDIAYAFNGTQDSITVTATVTAAENFSSGSCVLHLAMEEAYIHFATAPGTNGETDFYDIMRKMVPNASGTALTPTTWTNGQSQVITITTPIPTYIKNKNQICFVGWVQNVSTKRVHQAAFGKLSGDIGALGLGASASCGTSFTPSIAVKNNGTTPVTSYSLTYSIDGGAATTIAGTGTPLAGGATTNVMLPAGTYAVGTHTVTANTSMPNGSADMFVGNDAMGTQYFYIFPTVVAAPIAEGFQGTTFPPASWGVINGGSAAYTWTSAAYGGYQASSKCAYLDLWDAPAGDIDELVMPGTDLTGSAAAQLSFDIAKGLIPGQADRMKIVVSNDCGTTWTTVYDKDDNTGLSTTTYSTAAYYPSAANQWRTDVVNLSQFAGSSELLVKFVAISAYSQNLFLDNINLQGFAAGIKSNTHAVASVSVYPNPASSDVNVTVSLNKAQTVNVNIYNSVGALVHSEKKNMSAGDNTVNLNTAGLANGMYSVTVSTGDEFTTRKLTITK